MNILKGAYIIENLPINRSFRNFPSSIFATGVKRYLKRGKSGSCFCLRVVPLVKNIL